MASPSRPSLSDRPSSRLTDISSAYYTDDAATAGSRTPRQSMERARDTDAESQQFVDARSFSASVPSLAMHNQSTHNLAPPPQATTTSHMDHAHTTPRPPQDVHNTPEHVSHEEDVTIHQSQPIDEATKRAFQEEPKPNSASTDIANIAEGPAALASREAAGQAFLPQPGVEDATAPAEREFAAASQQTESSGTTPTQHSPPISEKQSQRETSTKRGSAVPSKMGSEKGDIEKEKELQEKHDAKASKKSKKAKKGDKSEKAVRVEDNPDLAHFTPEQKRIIIAQTEMGNEGRKATYLDIYHFSSKFELLLDLIGLICAAASGVVQPLMTLIFGNLTTSFVDYGRAVAEGAVTAEARARLFDDVNRDALYLLYIGIGMFGTTYIYMASWIYTGELTTRRIREAYLRAVLRQNIGFFDKLGAGEVTTRITSDMHLIQEGISEKIPITVQFLGAFVGGFVIAFIKNWRLTIVLSCIVPAIAITGAFMAKFQAAYRTKMLALIAEGGTLAEETISTIRTARAFGTANKLAALYDIPNAKAFWYGKKTAIMTAAGLATFFFIIYSSYALAFWWGTTLILQGNAVSGEVVTCFFAVLIGAFSLSQIAPNMQAVGYAIGAANKILFTIWRVPPIDSASTEGAKPEVLHGVITLRNVDFYYPSRPSVKVLDNYSATFPAGKTTALVGASGSGKSSVVGLIQRFYDIVGGSVELDGRDIKEYNIKWLRSRIGLVSQEPTLFSTTIWQNVAYGLINTPLESSDEATQRKLVVEACKLANAHDFIENLPEGYDTKIGERGMLLSGGQRQRVSIARAVVSNPPILLLDEATSALDTTSEVLVQHALDKASEGRTTIVIAHRLSTIKDADQIIVMTQGRIVEQGTHDSLLDIEGGAYAALVQAQALRQRSTAEESPEEADEQEARELMEREAKEAKEAAQMGDLKRTRSEASEVLERQRQAEEGKFKPKGHTILYLLFRLIREIWETKWYYLGGTFWSCVVGMVYPVFAIVFGALLGVFSTTSREELRSGGNKYAGYMFAVACVSAVAIAIQTYCFGYTSEYLSRRLRFRIYATTLRQDISFFDEDKNSTGALTSNISEQPQKVNAAAGVTLGVIIQSIVTLIGGVIVGLVYAPKVSAVGIACIPLTLSAGIVRLRVVNLKDEKVRKAHENTAQTACEAAASIRTVASLTREDDACEMYSRSLRVPMKVTNRIALISNVFFSISQALSFPTIALIFWYGSHQMVDAGLPTRNFFISLSAVVFGSIQAGNVFSFVPDVSSAKGAASQIVNLFDRQIEIDQESTEGKQVENVDGHVTFKGVHFRYPTRPAVRVLRGLNLVIKPGQFIALVGPSGCGKSTIIQLIERFYDPITGTVELDNMDVRELNVRSMREEMALVSQEPTLYDGSVRFNITLGATREVTEEEVHNACQQANIFDFVNTLPDGFDTIVGAKGSQLSGGQKQRISLARALIRNPKVLLLDEATSALDSQSEKVVQAALDAAAAGRTTIAVAHRLSTIQNADIIYVLKDGRVGEKGTHEELLQKQGIYFELVQQQALEKH